MSRYRKIETRLFADPRFRKLSKAQPCGQYLLLWLLTGPASSLLPGVTYGLGQAGLAEMLGWSQQGFHDALHEAIRHDLVKADLDAPLIFVPLAVEINPPQSINVVKSWLHPWEEIADCPLKGEIWEALKALLEGKAHGFLDEFTKACRMPRLIQKQEQEQNQDQKKESCGARQSTFLPQRSPLSVEGEPANSCVIGLPLIDGSEFPITASQVEEFSRLYPAVDVNQGLRAMRGWLIGNPKNKKTKGGVMRFVTGWLGKEQNRARSATSGTYTASAPMPSQSQKQEVVLPSDLNRPSGEKAWASIVAKLKTAIDAHSYQTWLQPLRGLGISKGALYVSMPSDDFQLVEETWGEHITAAAEAIGLNKIKFVSGAA